MQENLRVSLLREILCADADGVQNTADNGNVQQLTEPDLQALQIGA